MLEHSVDDVSERIEASWCCWWNEDVTKQGVSVFNTHVSDISHSVTAIIAHYTTLYTALHSLVTLVAMFNWLLYSVWQSLHVPSLRFTPLLHDWNSYLNLQNYVSMLDYLETVLYKNILIVDFIKIQIGYYYTIILLKENDHNR